MYSIYIFRRDLRLEDNLGLQFAIKNCKNIIQYLYLPPNR